MLVGLFHHHTTTEEISMKVRQRLHNRATPAADPLAGLVRYEIIAQNVPRGEYVLHSEAAKIVAAQREEIARLQTYETELLRLAETVGEENDPFAAWEHLEPSVERAKAAEAELAQIKAQKPAMWLCVRDDGGADRAITTSSPSRRDILKAEGYEITPLYFLPHAPEGGRD